MTIPSGVIGKFDPECDNCYVCYKQALKQINMSESWICEIHGKSTYDPTAELKELLREAVARATHHRFYTGLQGWHCAANCDACAWERRRKEALGE